MDWRLLKHFIAVVEEGSISSAALKIGLTQSALSRQMKALEEDLGVSLLKRSAHSIEPSPAGNVLARDGLKLLASIEQLRLRVRQSEQQQILHVGYSPSLAGSLLTKAMKRLREAGEQMQVILRDESSVNLRRLLAQSKLDLVVTAANPEHETWGEWQKLRSIHWRLAVSSTHPLAQTDFVSLSQLDGQGLLIFERENYPDYWQDISDWIARHKLRMSLVGEYDGVESLCAALEAGLGVALVAETTRLRAYAEVRLLKFADTPEPTQLCAGFAQGKQTNHLVKLLLEHLPQEALIPNLKT